LKKIEKILKYIENEKVTIAEFERKSGISNAYLKNTEERGADISLKILDKIKKSNPEDYYKIFPEENLKEAND
jgi:transcriptional regulator with XRE-family HTH domain